MGKYQLEVERNNNSRRLEHDSAIHRNCIRLHPQNSEEHEMKKAEICWELLREGREFVTEAKFKDHNIRADIFVLDDGMIYEIESSKYELEDRKSEYPSEDVVIVELWEDDEDA